MAKNVAVLRYFFMGLTIPFEYKKKDLTCADFIAFFTSFIDVQDIA